MDNTGEMAEREFLQLQRGQLDTIINGREIDDRNKEEESLLIRAQYESIMGIIENLELGVVRCTYPELKIIDINNKAYMAFTRNKPKVDSVVALKDKEISEISTFAITKDVINQIRDNMEHGDSLFVKTFNIEGDTFIKNIIQPIKGTDGKIVEVVLVAIDISDEMKLLKLQKELFVNISHELKTPLSIISSANQLIEGFLIDNLKEDERGKIYDKINMIRENTNRLIKLVNNILDLSKIDSGFTELELSNENIVSVVENIVQSIPEYIKGKKINVIFDTNTEEKIMAIDVDKIERCILNLVSNAIKFSDSGSQIDVIVLDKGDIVEISVKDQGIGIENEYLELIFQRFHQVDRSFSRNAEGTGIGLSLVKSIVELHEGKINVISESGKGSLFQIELPVKMLKEPDVAEQSTKVENIDEKLKLEFSDIY